MSPLILGALLTAVLLLLLALDIWRAEYEKRQRRNRRKP